MTLGTTRTRNGSSKKYVLAHKWTNNNLELQVKWTLGDVTWEPLSEPAKPVAGSSKHPDNEDIVDGEVRDYFIHPLPIMVEGA